MQVFYLALALFLNDKQPINVKQRSGKLGSFFLFLGKKHRTQPFGKSLLFYYESIKRELRRSPIYECRCEERLKTKAEGSTHLTYTGLRGGLEHLKIETRLIDEKIVDSMGEYVT